MARDFAQSRWGRALLSVTLCAVIGVAFYSVSRGFTAVADNPTASQPGSPLKTSSG